MYRMMTIAGLLKRVRRKRELAMCALAGMLLLAVTYAPVKAQVANTYTGTTVVHEGTIGLVPGQSVNVSVPNFYFQDGSVKAFLKHTIKVHAVTERESGLVYSGESGGIADGDLYYDYSTVIVDVNKGDPPKIFTFSYSDLKVAGEPGTGRVQLLIEVDSFASPTEEGAEISCAGLLASTIEVIEDGNGKTTRLGEMKESMETMKKAWN